MRDKDSGSSIRIHLDISVPTSGTVVESYPQMEQRKRHIPPFAVTIGHPDHTGKTFVKQDSSGRSYMCAKGNTTVGNRHLFAKVYLGSVTTFPGEPPTGDPDVGWTRSDPSTGAWIFDLLFVPVPIGLGNTKKIIVWAEDPSG